MAFKDQDYYLFKEVLIHKKNRKENKRYVTMWEDFWERV